MPSYAFQLPGPGEPTLRCGPSFSTRLPGYGGPAQLRAADPARLQHLVGETMGTTWSLRVDNPSMRPLDALRAALQAAFDEVVAQMSHWAPDSALSRFNRAPAGSVHVLPPAFAQVMARARHWAQASGGALDPSMAPLMALWGFGPDAEAPDRLPPDASRLAAARARCGWQRIHFDTARRTLHQPGRLSLDLSGIAKGFGVDAGVVALQALGLHDFLLEVGGELRGMGRRPGGQPWQVRIDTGEDDGVPVRRVALADCAVATSGDRWHVHERAACAGQAARRWSHTIDPRTGSPVAHALASVTVLHATCMDADALATVLTVLGPQAGLSFADRHGVAALFAERHADGAVRSRHSAHWPGHDAV